MSIRHVRAINVFDKALKMKHIKITITVLQRSENRQVTGFILLLSKQKNRVNNSLHLWMKSRPVHSIFTPKEVITDVTTQGVKIK